MKYNSLIFGIHVQIDGTNINHKSPISKLLQGGLSYSFGPKILDCTNNMIGGNKNNARAAENSFNDPINTIQVENNFIDLSVMDG